MALIALLCLVGAETAGAETIKVGGVGSLTPLMKVLGEHYSRQNPGVTVVVVHPPLGTTGAARALMAGKLDVALMGRPPHAEEHGKSTPWLQTPLVLATSNAHSAGLTRAQIADMYARRKSTWEHGVPVRLVLRAAHESETVSLRSMSPEIDAAVGEALKSGNLPMAENDIEALEVLARARGSLGTTSLGLITSTKTRIGALAIDGEKPSVKALEAGSYPWARQYYLMTRVSPTPAIEAFMAYLQSPAALAAARKVDYVAIKP